MRKTTSSYSAFDSALNYLSYKDRTIKEIQAKLKEKGYLCNEIDDAVDKLIYYGYVDEDKYAESYIKSNISKKSKKLISQELINKGLDLDTIEGQLDYIEYDESAVILNIIDRRFSQADFDDIKVYRRAYAYLMRRGFQYDAISKALSFYRKIYKNNLVL